MAGLDYQVHGELDLHIGHIGSALPCSARSFQNIPIRMKKPTSIRKAMDMVATVKNTSPAERGLMNAPHLAKPQGSK